jgi:phospholipid/cholesterol/gamma-HCH transport system ATP-binding protein
MDDVIPQSEDAHSGHEIIVELKDICKSFGGGVVHDGVNFSVRRGEVITLAGGSGQGKTVLLKEIIGLTKPDSGCVMVFGRDVTTMSERELQRIRGDVAMVFQGSALFDSLTVGENVAYGLIEQNRGIHRDDVRDTVAEKLQLVDLPDTQALMPAELSGGMRKRVALARALALDPKVILYDEPTTGLDPANVRRINALITKLQSSMSVTSIIVTHDMDSTRTVTDRLALLDRGRIIAVGSWSEMENSTLTRVRKFLEGDFGE